MGKYNYEVYAYWLEYSQLRLSCPSFIAAAKRQFYIYFFILNYLSFLNEGSEVCLFSRTFSRSVLFYTDIILKSGS